MAKNYDNIRVYGDLASEVYLAPKGSTLPTTITTEPATPFDPLGWLSDGGINLAVSTEIQKFKGYQGGTTVRVKVTSTEKTISMQALEETPGVTELYFDHGAPVVTGVGAEAVARIDLPESIGTVERTGIFRFVDNDVQKWLCAPLVQVTEREEIPHTNADMTIYGFSLEIIGDAYLLTNNPAYLLGAA